MKPITFTHLTVLNPGFMAVFAALAMSAASNVYAQPVEIKNSWVRTAVPGQKATGAFMTLTAKDGLKLVGGSSPAAGVTEIHEMKMEGDVMRMRALKDGLPLPAGQAVELKPGGYHVMLMDLKAPLPKDTSIPLTLVFKDAKGVESKMEIKLQVAATAPDGKKITSNENNHKH